MFFKNTHVDFSKAYMQSEQIKVTLFGNNLLISYIQVRAANGWDSGGQILKVEAVFEKRSRCMSGGPGPDNVKSGRQSQLLQDGCLFLLVKSGLQQVETLEKEGCWKKIYS